ELLMCADIDLERLRIDRLRTNSFGDAQLYLTTSFKPFTRIAFKMEGASVRGPKAGLLRTIDPHPFVPKESAELNDRSKQIFQSQVAGLAKRLEHANIPRPGLPTTIGISGGLDSTLALLVACKTFDALELPRSGIMAITMPGFGTTKETRANATKLMKLLKVT